MSNVTVLPDVKEEDDSDELLERMKGKFRGLFLIGWNKDGVLEIRSSSTVDLVSMIYMMEVAKLHMLDDTTE